MLTATTEICLAALRLHEALDAVGDGLLPAVEALDRDENAVALRLGVAQVAEGDTHLGIGNGTGFVVFGGRSSSVKNGDRFATMLKCAPQAARRRHYLFRSKSNDQTIPKGARLCAIAGDTHCIHDAFDGILRVLQFASPSLEMRSSGAGAVEHFG